MKIHLSSCLHICLFVLYWFFLFPLGSVLGETFVSGTISTDTTWAIINSPYIITGSVTVQGTDGADAITTLTIEPGVELRFNNYTRLTVGGTSGDPGALVAQGTIGQPIVFTANQDIPAPGNWYGLRFQTTAGATSILDYCLVDYGGYSSGAVYVRSSAPTISNTTIQNSKSQGLYSYSADPVISGNTFNTNGNYDLYYTGTSAGAITGNTVNNGLLLPANTITDISGNTFNCNSAYPIKVPANDVGRVLANTLTNTTANHLEITAGAVSTDATWPAKLPLHVTGSVIVQGTDGADAITTLTIDPGVELRFNLYTQLYVGNSSGDPGALVAQGTFESPILFTANQDVPAPGKWYGIRFRATSAPSSIL